MCTICEHWMWKSFAVYVLGLFYFLYLPNKMVFENSCLYVFSIYIYCTLFLCVLYIFSTIISEWLDLSLHGGFHKIFFFCSQMISNQFVHNITIFFIICFVLFVCVLVSCMILAYDKCMMNDDDNDENDDEW